MKFSKNAKEAYIVPYVFLDELLSFYTKVYKWNFDINDKRKIKRIKKFKMKK